MSSLELLNFGSADEGSSLPDVCHSTASCLPVKNTFIHFEGAQKRKCRRILRPCQTDPEAFAASVETRTSKSDSPTPMNFESDSGSPGWISTTSLDLGSDSCSTTASCSEIDPLNISGDACIALDFDGFGLHTPEQSPRHARDPWLSPESPRTEMPMAQATHIMRVDAASFAPSVCLPVSIASTPSMPTSLPTSPASSVYDAALSSLGSPSSSDSGYSFGFTLRLADEVGLGVDLVPHVQGVDMLFIQHILPHGAMACWNKQCFEDSAKRFKAVWPGDAIVSVNGKSDHWAMLEECKTKMLLKLIVLRASCGTAPCSGPMSYWPPVQGHMSARGQRLHSCKKLIVI